MNLFRSREARQMPQDPHEEWGKEISGLKGVVAKSDEEFISELGPYLDHLELRFGPAS